MAVLLFISVCPPLVIQSAVAVRSFRDIMAAKQSRPGARKLPTNKDRQALPDVMSDAERRAKRQQRFEQRRAELVAAAAVAAAEQDPQTAAEQVLVFLSSQSVCLWLLLEVYSSL